MFHVLFGLGGVGAIIAVIIVNMSSDSGGGVAAAAAAGGLIGCSATRGWPNLLSTRARVNMFCVCNVAKVKV